MSQFNRIAVLAGGFSNEREISLRSGKNVHAALLELGYDAFLVDPLLTDLTTVEMDCAFNVLHGCWGEDGTVQALLDSLKIPYAGSGVSASVIGMNKLITKQLLKKHNLPTLPFSVVGSDSLTIDEAISFPVITKPISGGSSLGMVIVDEKAEFEKTIHPLIEKYGPLLVEPFVTGTEITVSVIEYEGELKALPILELRPKNRFYDYEAKYTAGMTDFILPAQISATNEADALRLAMAVHTLVGCSGMSRVDMMVTPEGCQILEINTLPGMTDTSDLPQQAAHAGISFTELVNAILLSVK